MPIHARLYGNRYNQLMLRPCTVRIFAWIKAIIGLGVSPRGRQSQASLLGNPRAYRSLRYYFAIILRRYNETHTAVSQKCRCDKENDTKRDAWKVEERVT